MGDQRIRDHGGVGGEHLVVGETTVDLATLDRDLFDLLFVDPGQEVAEGDLGRGRLLGRLRREDEQRDRRQGGDSDADVPVEPLIHPHSRSRPVRERLESETEKLFSNRDCA